jgi:hypothetical protein
MSSTDGDYFPEAEAGAEIAKRTKRKRPFTIHTLRAWRRDGTGPAPTIVGRDVLYRDEAITAWLLSQEVKP